MSDDDLSRRLAQLHSSSREVYASALGEIESCDSDAAAGQFIANLLQGVNTGGSFEKILCALRKKQSAQS